MSTIKQILTFAYESAYDLSNKKLFSKPKIYTANGDLSKRWYVYFSFRDPKTNKLKRLTSFYGNANRFRSKEERMDVLLVYRRVLLKLLRQGYNPFEDNTELFKKLQDRNSINNLTSNKDEEQNEKVKSLNEPKAEPKLSLKEAFNNGLKLKEKIVSKRTLKDYSNKTDLLLKWVNQTHPNIKTID